jgi:uncharacterized repeat protein (TIGR01451 family)
LLAAVRSREDYLLTNERVEWSIAPCGVGRFLDVSTNWVSDWFFGEFERGKVGPTLAISTTSRSSFTITRGTPNPADDVPVLAGQAWASLTSPVEGVSQVTAYAPNVVGWPSNKHVVTIQWVDPRRPQAALVSPTAMPHPVSPTPAPVTIPVTPTTPPPTTSPTTTTPSAAVPPTTPPPTITTPPTIAQPRPALEVSVQGPTQAAVGNTVSFQILLTNRGSTPATNLIIRDRFDVGLQHAQATNSIERELTSIGPGERQAITVDFRVTRAGRLCHTVDVRNSSGVLATSQACLMATEARATPPATSGPTVPPLSPPTTTPPAIASPPTTTPPTTPPVTQPSPPPATLPLSVQVNSPTRVTVGETAKHSIRVINTTGRKLSKVKISARVDTAWTAKQASAGVIPEGDSLVWNVGLDPNGSVLVEIECLAEKPSQRACVRASVKVDDVANGSGEACTEIREVAKPSQPAASPPPELKVTAASLRNPVAEGRELTYEVRVTNAGAAPASQVIVTATVPAGMTPLTFGTTGPTQPALEGQTLRFEPVAELPPGQTLTYRIRTRPQQPGDFRFHVDAICRGAASPFTADATTQVFKAP